MNTTTTRRARSIAATVGRRTGLIAALVLGACSGATGYGSTAAPRLSTAASTYNSSTEGTFNSSTEGAYNSPADGMGNYGCNNNPGTASVVVVRVTQGL